MLHAAHEQRKAIMDHDDEQLRAAIIDQLSAIAFAQPSAFFKKDADGQLRVDLTDCTPQQLEPLKDFQMYISQAPGRGHAPITRFGFKMQNKMQALDRLYKIVKMDQARNGRRK